MTLVVASYNIHRCIGRDGRSDPARIAAVLRELDADVIALQEVEAEHHPDALDQWIYLARSLDYVCTPGISLRTQRRNYGNALLSRWPVETVRLHDLSVRRREPRGAIEVELAVGDGRRLSVVATHLGLKRHERRQQIDRLMALLTPAPETDALVLLGDLNEWRPGSDNLRRLGQRFGLLQSPPTFPSRYPLFALDRILLAGGAAVNEVGSHASPLARLASDHLPIRACLDWSPR